jgi:coenzyme F420 biosynthesis associated uncharacterized protein
MTTTPGPVDWVAAGRLGGRLAPPGPSGPPDELRALVDGLRAAAAHAAAEVGAIARMQPADGRPAAALSRVLVVDRAGWAAANASIFAAMVEGTALGGHSSSGPAGPAGRTPSAGSAGPSGRTPSAGSSSGTAAVSSVPGPVAAVGRAAATAEVGTALAVLSSRVLGQFDPFSGPHDEAGRLLLVAPNVLEVRRRLGVPADDFTLWVCLHEQTHALQFAAAPWLVGHLLGLTARLVEEAGPDRLLGAGDARELVATAARALAGRDGAGLAELLSPPARAVFDEVGAVMSLLEGHADVTMDQVGPRVVPAVREIRRRFAARRDTQAGARGVAAVVRRLLGMDLKLAQYRQGAAFVRGVRRHVGVDGFNAVWTSPQALPTAAEIADPGAWVARVRP